MTAATGNEQQRVDVLLAHARGMRAASESKGITLSAKACGNLAADLEQVHAAVAELIEKACAVRSAHNAFQVWKGEAPKDAPAPRLILEMNAHAKAMLFEALANVGAAK